ncbi:ABC transporter ATP-binding protein/permease [bacterium]|nr:ABC transporter ATP-binding protein/permease [bacterium]
MADQQRTNPIAQFFIKRFSLQDNALWRVMGLLKSYHRLILMANICLAVSQMFTGAGIVVLYPMISYAFDTQAGTKTEQVVGKQKGKESKDSKYEKKVVAWVEGHESVARPYHQAVAEWNAFNDWMKTSRLRFFGVYSAFLVVLFLLKGLIQFVGNYLMARVSINVTSDLMNRVYGNVLRQELAFFDRTPTGTLLNLCYREIFNMQPLITMLASTRIVMPVTMLILFGTLLVINVMLSLMLLVLLPVVILPTMAVTRWMRQSLKGELSEESQVMDIMTQGLNGILAIKSFGAERLEQQYLEPAVAAYIASSRSRRAAQSLVAPMVDLLNMIVLLLVFVLSMVWFYDPKTLNAGVFTTFMLALTRFYKPMTTMMRMDVNMHRARALARRIFELLDRVPEIRNADDAVDFPTEWDKIRFENVSLSYTVYRKNRSAVKREALKPVDLAIARGEAIGIIGPNGAGKSSIMKLLCRLYDPTGGRIWIGLTPLERIKLESMAKNICLITQHPVLFNRSVRDNITFSLEDGVSDEMVMEAARLAGADAFIEKLPNGYDTLIGENGRLLSGGERQKVMLARAFVRKPSILILDEPTTGLDQKTLAEFLDSVWKLHEQGITIIYITHEHGYLEKFDRVFEFKADHSVNEMTTQPSA